MAQMDNLKVSIVMAYYNRYPQLRTTLDTISLSSHKNVEVIIVDDCSNDGFPIDSVIPKYSYPINIIKMDPKEKTYTNSCIPFNRGIEQVTGDIIVIQNPEVCHIGDVLKHIVTNLTRNDYFSYACIAMPNMAYNNYLRNVVIRANSSINKPGVYSSGIPLKIIPDTLKNYKGHYPLMWYNNPDSPTYFHFCAATYTTNIRKVRGFSIEYATGRCFDDDDLVFKMQHVLGLNMIVPPITDCYVAHQYHPPSPAVNCTLFPPDNPVRLGYEKNQAILENKKAVHSKFPLFNSIPKIFHSYWDGSPLTLAGYLTIRTFHYYNPEYEIIIWTPKKKFNVNTWKDLAHVTSYTGHDYWPQLQKQSYVQIRSIDMESIGFSNDVSEVIKSDFLRYYIIGTMGGLWSDMDIIYLKPVSDILKTVNKDFDTLLVYEHNYFDFNYDPSLLNTLKRKFIGRVEKMEDRINSSKPLTDYYPVAFFMACKNNKFFQDLHHRAKIHYNPLAYQCLGCHMLEKEIGSAINEYGSLNNKYPELTIGVAPISIYLPVLWYETEKIFKNSNFTLPENSIGIHLFGASDCYKEYSNDVNKTSNTCFLTKLINKFNYIEKNDKLTKPIINLN